MNNNMDELKQNDIYSKTTRMGDITVTAKSSMPILESYTIQREIGKGGMAIVYEAIEKSLNRAVALKVLSKELSKDNELIKRFVNEAQAAARLSHPNIVQIYSIGQERDVYYFAMEFVRGETVEDILNKRKKISVVQAVDIAKQTVLALREAYKNNIIHRDIKPGNLLIAEQGLVKVADFGLAGEVRGAVVDMGGKIIGTPLYMSPEQAQGMEGDFRSDIYSLGVTFYQMLSGKPPFMSSDTKVLIKKHIESDLPALSADIPVSVKKIIRRMTAKNPADRFNDYDLLLKELENAYRQLTGRRYTSRFLLFGLLIAAGAVVYTYYTPYVQKQTVIPNEVEKYKRVAAMYGDVELYASRHPEAHRDIISQYFEIMKDYPNTEWAFRAEQKIDKIIQAAVKEAQEELQGLKNTRDDLVGKRNYKEAVSKYQEIKEKYRDTDAETVAQKNIDYVMEKANEDFRLVEEKAKEYLSHYKFDNARELYEDVIKNYGLKEYVKEAQNKIRFINELEKNHTLETEAKRIFEPLRANVDACISEHKYNEARRVLESAKITEENSALSALIKDELEKIEKAQIEYESKALKEKMVRQYSSYNEINDKVRVLIADYRYADALTLVKAGVSGIDTTEWKNKLEITDEKLKYLQLLKGSVIKSINTELKAKNVKDISADENKVIFIVEGGYVGVSWKESSSQKIYQAAQKYVENSAEGHIALGVFCLTYKLLDDARREFTMALRIDLTKQDTIEKYLAQLAEADKE